MKIVELYSDSETKWKTKAHSTYCLSHLTKSSSQLYFKNILKISCTFKESAPSTKMIYLEFHVF